MVPIFPQFKNLEISDKESIEEITKRFPPYSDFNFVSLWAWNTKKNTQISQLNNNFVIRLDDYITHKPSYSFIGTNKAIEATEKLLNLSKQKGLEEKLSLIPDTNFVGTSLQEAQNKFSVIEDRDSFDYILDVKNVSTMEGNDLHQKRKLMNHFIQQYPHTEETHGLTKADEQKVIDFFIHWEKVRNKDRKDTENELNATKRLFIEPDSLNLMVNYLRSENKIIGYNIFEIIDKQYSVSDFQKADFNFEGATEFLNQTVAKFLNEQGVSFLNIEQDMGIEGLRRAKLDYAPTFLKKYIVRRRTS